MQEELSPFRVCRFWSVKRVRRPQPPRLLPDRPGAARNSTKAGAERLRSYAFAFSLRRDVASPRLKARGSHFEQFHELNRETRQCRVSTEAQRSVQRGRRSAFMVTGITTVTCRLFSFELF